MRVGLVGAHPIPARDASHPARPTRGAVIAETAAALAERGSDVTVFTARHDPDAPARFDVDGYRVVQTDTAIGTQTHDLVTVLNDFTRFLDTAWQADRPDVVHADSWVHGVAAQLAADRQSIPSVQTFPQLGAVLSARQSRIVGPPARARLERLLARSATQIAAACSEDVAELIRMGCPRSRIAVLPHGVDIEVFAPTGPAAERDDAGPSFRVVAAVDVLLPHQGLDDVIRATAKLSDVEAVIVGGLACHDLDRDAEVTRLRELAAAEGASDRVRFTGALPAEARAAVLRSADVFVCASWFEPCNAAVIEAMACGVPVVATEAGGMADAVINDVTGVLVPPRDTAKLLAALTAMLHGGLLREGMGLAGRARARSCYAWDRVAVEADSLHQRAVDSHGPARDRRSVTMPVAR